MGDKPLRQIGCRLAENRRLRRQCKDKRKHLFRVLDLAHQVQEPVHHPTRCRLLFARGALVLQRIAEVLHEADQHACCVTKAKSIGATHHIPGLGLARCPTGEGLDYRRLADQIRPDRGEARLASCIGALAERGQFLLEQGEHGIEVGRSMRRSLFVGDRLA